MGGPADSPAECGRDRRHHILDGPLRSLVSSWSLESSASLAGFTVNKSGSSQAKDGIAPDIRRWCLLQSAASSE